MKILYVTTLSGTINAFLTPHVKMLIEQGYQVDLACNITSPINKMLLDYGCNVYNIEFQRSPLSKQNYHAYKKLKEVILKGKYDIIHTHTPIASTCVRIACRNIKNIKVIYTAHGFHFYKGAPLKNWLIYYPIEKLLSAYTDVLITINQEDYKRASENFNAKRIEYLPGVGLDINEIDDLVVDKSVKRKELNVPENSFVLLSVGELNKNKNHETVIKALAKLNNKNIYYVICGKGPLESYLIELSRKLGVEKQVKLLGFRKDIVGICKVVDVFVFPSFREGLSIALMEAMESGLPVICSDIRGNSDLIDNGKGGLLVEPNDVNGFAESIDKVLLDNENKMAVINKETIKSFKISNVLKRIQEIYRYI